MESPTRDAGNVIMGETAVGVRHLSENYYEVTQKKIPKSWQKILGLYIVGDE